MYTHLEKWVKSIVSQICTDTITAIHIAWASASWKTTLAFMIQNYLGPSECLIISMDDYYKGRRFLESEEKAWRYFTFDDIESIDTSSLLQHIQLLKQWKSVDKPLYSMRKQAPDGSEVVAPKKVIIIEGIYALHDTIIWWSDISIFIESNPKERFQRRIGRDTERAWKTLEQMKQDLQDIDAKYETYIVPTMKNATIVIQN